MAWLRVGFQSVVCCLVAGMAGAGMRVHAETLFVHATASGANSGASWTDAYTDLQTALASATAGDAIWVAAGSYKPTPGTDRAVSFVLPASVGVYGGFLGSETLLDQRDMTTTTTILSGDIGNAGQQSDNSYHVVIGAANATLDGFRIQQGNANGSGHSTGGGILNSSAGLSIANCIISDNRAQNQGGGIKNSGSGLVLTRCEISNNRIAFVGNGGGLYNAATSSTLTQCVIKDNSAVNGAGIANVASNFRLVESTLQGNAASTIGGAVFCNAGSITLTDCALSSNTANWGAGLYLAAASTLSGCRFVANSARNYGGCVYTLGSTQFDACVFEQNNADISGGALQLEQGPSVTRVADCVFEGNTAPLGAGAYTNIQSTASLVISGSIFRQNLAGKAGGGLYINNSGILEDCILIENQSFSGGTGSGNEGGAGLYQAAGNSLITNCVFARNTANANGSTGGVGGGLYLRQTASKLTHCTLTDNVARGAASLYISSNVEIVNSIVWANTNLVPFVSQGSPVFKYCLVGGSGGSAAWFYSGFDGGGNIDADPQFYDAENPAGSDQTLMTADDGLRLKYTSPCLDAGLPAGAPPADLLNTPRAATPTLGAYEGYLRTASAAWVGYP